MEGLVTTSREFWNGRSVFVTGHTGFKGGWLSLWLHALGAKVHGYALNPPTDPSFFTTVGIQNLIASDTRRDLADLAALKAATVEAAPTVVFHLAAQPLVREGYRDPLGTIKTNVLGTANVLEAVRGCSSVEAVIVITTDKVYENREWMYPYREIDPLGGYDPYSASKAAAELVTASYRSSFFSATDEHGAKIASARAGNVIGGGDWGRERLVPDCLKAFESGSPVKLRYPNSVRPWQHVLEPIAGYLLLAETLCTSVGSEQSRAWNFGPNGDGDGSVLTVANTIAELWGDGAEVVLDDIEDLVHEAGLLRLDSSLAKAQLGWKPRWTLRTALERTVDWHRAWMRGDDMVTVGLAQIGEYSELLERA